MRSEAVLCMELDRFPERCVHIEHAAYSFGLCGIIRGFKRAVVGRAERFIIVQLCVCSVQTDFMKASRVYRYA